jgi:hypothetical protein
MNVVVLCADSLADRADVERPGLCRMPVGHAQQAHRGTTSVQTRIALDRSRRRGPHVQTVSTLNLESAQITKTARPIAMKDQTGL